MDQAQYSDILLDSLRRHSGPATRTLEAMGAVLPERTKAIHIGVHPSQDSDGTFTVMVHLDGPDLYVLNKAVADHRTLFDVVYAGDGASPEVPTFDPFDTEFSVNDTIVDTVALWIAEIWLTLGMDIRNLPALVFGEDGYGTRMPKILIE